MRLVHCARLRRVCGPTRPDNKCQPTIHFRRNFSAPDLIWRRGSACYARCVAILRRNCHGEDFQHVEYLPASSARRNRAQAAQQTQLVDELSRRHCQQFIVDNRSRGKYSMSIVLPTATYIAKTAKLRLRRW